MRVKELIALLQAQDPELEVIAEDEAAFELSGVELSAQYTGKRLPTERPGVYDLEKKIFVVIR